MADVEAVAKHDASCREREMEAAFHMTQERLRQSPLWKDFPEIGKIMDWKRKFEVDNFRFPILILLGPSRASKTQYAMSLFERPLVLRLGDALHFPDGLRRLSEGQHDGVVLDDCRDCTFVQLQQDALQSGNMIQEFAKSPTGQYSFRLNLYKIPFIITMNFSTRNLRLLTECDFCSHQDNTNLVLYPPVAIANALGVPSFSFPPVFEHGSPALCAKLLERSVKV